MIIGYIFSLFSAFAMAVSSVAAKQALRKEHSLDFSIFAHILGLLFLSPFIGYIDFNISYYQIGLIYMVSFFGTFGFWFTIRALRHLDVGVVAPLLNFSVIFTVIFGYWFLNERLGALHLLGVFFIVFGAYILEINHGKIDLLYPFREFKKSKYYHYLFWGILFYAIGSIADRIILQQIDVLTYLFYVYLFLLVNYILIFVYLHKVPFSTIFSEAKDSAGWLTLFSVSKLISNFLFASAVGMMYIGIVVAIKRLSVLFSIIFGGKFLHEEHFRWRMFSSLIMLLGIILIVFA